MSILKKSNKWFKKLENYEKKHGNCPDWWDGIATISANAINEADEEIKQLTHHKDTTVGLYATDKEPDKIFELIMNTIDGDKCMSAMDYDYYKNIFDTEIKKLMFRIS